MAATTTLNEKDPRGGLGDAPQPRAERARPSSRYLKLKRLPTLQEVLDRRTRPPLDLFCFYIFLQRESSEDALDFWLDVQQHENLCKAYFKDLKRSGRTVDEDWPEFANYARRNGSYMTPMLDLSGSGSAEHVAPARRSSELVADSLRGLSSPDLLYDPNNPQHGAGPGAGRVSAASQLSHPEREKNSRNWAARKSRAPTVFARDRAIEKHALVESAERIYLRYLLPGAEREVYLPTALRLSNFPVSSEGHTSPLIPDLFHAQKLYIFRALEQDAFPRFLRAKAFGNLTPMSSFVRLVLGLAVLWGAFVLAFTLIFLDWKPRRVRAWVILPFFVAFNLLLAAYYSLSPLFAIFFQSETTPFRLITVREAYVRKLILLRALWIESLVIVLTAIFTVIFCVVPGHRL
ncbi:Bud site selection protein, Revert to axial protein 1 [Vanrija albida]|uniref:Bud site selection protein, Revert to axial protein 1 n=1 Tax=Vanrija albida TaxID=181172 RepID=A0ABR3Q0A5_9TREE